MAQWDTSCSFEAQNNWIELLINNYGIDHLVNEHGDVQESNNDDQVHFLYQADMCEILRTVLALYQIDEKEKTIKDVDIHCPGSAETT